MLAEIEKLEPKEYSLAYYLMELALYNLNIHKNANCLIAASALYLIRKIKRENEVWPDKFRDLTNFEESKVRDLGKMICNLLEL